MRPNLSGIVRVQGRIEEIERRIRPKKELPEPPKQERFVDVLEREEAKLPLPCAACPGSTTSMPTRDRKSVV